MSAAELPATADVPPHYPSLREATAVWARIGLLSFGGPAGQIALMHKELVEDRRWIAESRFFHALNFCMLLPGPEAQQLATYVGWLLHGTRGGVIAGTLFIIPGFVTIVILSVLYATLSETAWLASIFFGLKAAVLAIVLEAVFRVGKRALRTWTTIAIAAAAFLALFVFAVPFPLVVLAAGIVGYAGSRIYPRMFAVAGHDATLSDRPSAIGQDFPQAQPDLGAALATTAIWCALWAAPLLMIGLAFGWSGTFSDLWLFFSQMALVTFGGAYAVLAYVAQEAVQHFGWLRPGEMVDGLALAETTPGPLVLVLSFVGFQAAYRDAGGMDPIVAGVIGATVSAWVTFVPCFLWIFLGAPHIEKLRSNAALSGALATITAAVVGVILNLAIWFGLHVLFRDVVTLKTGPVAVAVPNWATVDPFAVVLATFALASLLWLKLGVFRTLAACAAIGLAVWLSGYDGTLA